jgi:excisionase family DNA binding protein
MISSESKIIQRVLDGRWDGRSTFTVEEAGCEILGLSKCSAYAAVNSGELPAIRIGRRWIVPRHALERILSG